MKVKSKLKYFRLSAFDTSTEQGRIDERYRLALLAITTNIISKCVTALITILSIRWTMPYLGEERLGVWLTIASFAGILGFLDFGVGNALTNHVAKTSHLQKRLLQRVISGGVGILFIIAALITLILTSTFIFLPWAKIINFSAEVTELEIVHTAICFAIIFGLSIVSTGVQKIYNGLQHSFENYLISSVFSILSLLLLWLCVGLEADITLLLISTYGVQTLGGIYLLLRLYQRDLFSFKEITIAVRHEKLIIVQSSGLFLALQIGTMIGWGADSLIISSTLGPAAVATFVIVQRLFLIVTIPLSIINAPLWALYADASVRNEQLLIAKTLKKSLFVTGGFAVFGGGILFLFSHDLISLWTKNSIAIPSTLVFVFYIWIIFETLGTALSMMLNGCNIIKPQLLSIFIFICLSLPLKLFLIKFGLTYFITGTIFSYLIAAVGFYFIFWRFSVKRGSISAS
jgi:O-antigen/teichoic acid export membrane protein